jgi:hypothetical protein
LVPARPGVGCPERRSSTVTGPSALSSNTIPAKAPPPFQLVPFDRIADHAGTDPGSRAIADLRALPATDQLSWATAQPILPLARLVTMLHNGNFLPTGHCLLREPDRCGHAGQHPFRHRPPVLSRAPSRAATR